MKKVCYIIIAFLFNLCLYAQEEDKILEFYKKVDKNYYYPTQHGLKDLKVDVDIEITVQFPMPTQEQMNATLYFKKPDKRKVELETDLPAQTPQQLKEQIEEMVNMVVKQPYVDRYKKEKQKWEWKLKKTTKGFVMIKTPTEDNQEAQVIERVHETYNRKYRLVKVVEILQDGQTVTKRTKKTIKKHKKLLPSKVVVITEEDGNTIGKINAQMQYKKIKKLWFLKKAVMEMNMQREIMGRDITVKTKITLTYKDYKVNKGLDDKIFED